MKLLLLALLIACSDPLATEPNKQCAAVVNVVDVASESELTAALRAGYQSFRLTNSITITAPLFMDTFPIGAFFALTSTGGYGAHIERGFDGSEPLFRFGDARAYRIRLEGIAFVVPTAFKNAGPSIDIRHMFVSVWLDVMFEYHPHRPFIIRGGAALSFYNLGLVSNGESALMLEMGDLSFIGGYIEDHRYDAPNWGTGLDAYATQDRTGAVETPLLWLNVHQEFSNVNLHGFARVQMFPGYCLLCNLDVHEAECG